MSTAHPVSPDDLATAIADGKSLDWSQLLADARTPEARARIARFALLARVAAVHAGDGNSDRDAQDVLAMEAPATLPDLMPGDRWGSLRIVERLAAGTFGTVYWAHDSRLARDVALKLLNRPAQGLLATDAIAEGRLLAKVRHPHVVAVYGADWHDARAGVWMELVDGRTLEEELLARGPLPVAEVTAIGIALASAIQAVHAAGLLHRDLKTQNVMRDRDGRVVLMDFSAGREQVDGARGRLPATLAGSPLYLAPECLDGAAATVRSDIYSLGVVLHRLATGHYPVEGGTLGELARRHRSRNGRVLPRLSALAPTLVGLLSRMLSPVPMDCPSSGADVLRLLHATDGTIASHSSRRRRAAMAVMTLLVAGGLALASQPSQHASQRDTAVVRSDLPVTTVSADARELFDQGVAALLLAEQTTADETIAAWRRAEEKLALATDLDPSFASAWLFRASAAAARSISTDEVIAFAERGLMSSAHLPQAERSFIEAVAHRLRADRTPDRRDELQSAARSYEQVLGYAPQHYWALMDLHGVYNRLQQAVDADRVALLAAQAHPSSLRAGVSAARAHLRSGDERALRLVVERALTGITPDLLKPGALSSYVAWLVLWEVRAAWMAGDPGRALHSMRKLSTAPEHASHDALNHLLSASAIALGRFDEARMAIRRIESDGLREFGLAVADARQERWASLRTALAPGGHVPPPQNRRFEFMYIMAGMLREAEEQLPHLRPERRGPTWQVAQEFEAHLRVKQGRHAEALALFSPLLADERGPRLYMQEQVAIARRGVGDLTGAISVLERFEREPVLVHVDGFSGHDWLRCVLRLAEFYQEQGRQPDAARAAAKVRAMLRFADPDHPFVARLEALP